MKNVSLLVPAGFTDRRRHEIYLWVMNRWLSQFPDWQVCIGEDDPTNYNRSRARNEAFSKAYGDILVISDADTVTSMDNIEKAIAQCLATESWIIAHEFYYSLSEEFTDYLLERPPTVELASVPSRSMYNWVMHNKSEAGVLVMPRGAYEAADGYDERFNGWGYEDNAFASKLRKAWGEPQRTSGQVCHLWHDPGLNFQQPHIKENEALFEEIKNAV
jgi:predicted glycosyltransferase involved in capsule biosynthesis